MNRNLILLVLVVGLAVVAGCSPTAPTGTQGSSTPQTPPDTEAPTTGYLGQKAPGMTSTQFAPDIIDTIRDELHSGPVFSPDATEVY